MRLVSRSGRPGVADARKGAEPLYRKRQNSEHGCKFWN
jgi:hypothetical protein